MDRSGDGEISRASGGRRTAPECGASWPGSPAGGWRWRWRRRPAGGSLSRSCGPWAQNDSRAGSSRLATPDPVRMAASKCQHAGLQHKLHDVLGLHHDGFPAGMGPMSDLSWWAPSKLRRTALAGAPVGVDGKALASDDQRQLTAAQRGALVPSWKHGRSGAVYALDAA